MSSEEVNGGGSFLSRNIGGIILAVILTVLFCATAELSLIRKIFGFILGIPLSFLGYFLGNKLRLLLHPDFVLVSGFWGLLKERIFWRFIPQFIGALIGGAIAITVASAGVEGSSTGKISKLPDVKIVEEKIASYITNSLQEAGADTGLSGVKLKNAPKDSGNTWIGTVKLATGGVSFEENIAAKHSPDTNTVTWWFVDTPDEKFTINSFK
jgi:hypothetical protein